VNTCLKPEFYTGWKLILFGLKFWFSLGKYFFQKKKYPLFSLKLSIRSLVKPKRELELKKIVRFSNHYYLSVLKAPRWPSKPFDLYVANGGLNTKAAGTPLKSHIDFVVLAMTRKCHYNCKHCYEYFHLAETDSVPVERWKEVIKELQNLGVGTIVLSGGEPMLRYDGLLELIKSGDKRRSDFHIHTSGNCVTSEKALALKKAGLIAAGVGLDDLNQKRQDTFRGYQSAFIEATTAIKYLREAGIFVYLNNCLTKELIRSGDLWNYFDLAKDLKVGTIQLYEPKPCGRYLSEKADDLFSENDRKIVTEFFKSANQKKKYRDYPKVTYVDYFENADHLGCLMGGLSHFHIDSLGNVAPCVFLPISYGNILQEDLVDIYTRMRKAIPGPLFKQCPSVFLAEKIKLKRNQGIELPIPYEEIENDWHKMFE